MPQRRPGPTSIRPSGAEAPCRESAARNAGVGVALALGGGFSRGVAHLGVLEILEQERIPVVAIAGTSIGGLLGAAYADHISIQQLCELGRNVRVRDFVRYQRSSKDEQGKDAGGSDCIGSFVRNHFLSSRIESLGIPTAIVTTDLSNGAPYVFTQGPLEVAIRATCAFPGLFKAVEYDGRLLADGCIVSPVPTRTAAQMNAACVLGVAVGMEKATPARRRVIKLFSRAKGYVRRLIEPSWAREADILLAPEVQQIDWNDFSRVDEARAAGADAMRRALPQVRELLERQSLIRRLSESSGKAESRAAL
jgi:NTE family protein